MAVKGSKANAATRAALEAGRFARKEELQRRREERANGPSKSRHQRLLDGELPYSELDDDELRLGRGRDIDGEFKGRLAPIPQKVVAKLHAEIFRRHGEMMRGALVAATATLIELANNEEVKDEVRIKAAALLVERNVGKVPQDIRIGSIDPWEQILGDMMEGGLNNDDAAVARAKERLGRMAPKLEQEDA